MTAPHCIKPASITITASIAACIGCLCVATVPTERCALRPDANEAASVPDLQGGFWQGKETTMTTTIETSIVRRAPGMEFDVSIAGNPGRPLVLMLHGFCVSRHYWESQAVALAEAGYFAAARNQRGYAPGARPDPAEHR